MDILIGKQGNQPFKLTDSTISRNHALFHLDPATRRMTIKDTNSTNGTWLLAKDGKFKRINDEVQVGPETLVRLGETYTFRIKQLLAQPEEPPVDISDLKTVYEVYTQNKLILDGKSSNIMMWRMASMSLGGILAMVLAMFVPEDFAGNETIGIVIKILGSLIALGLSWCVVDMMNKNLIKRKDMNEKFFKQKYSCPRCGYHFGAKVYHNIVAEGRCPNNSCKCKYTGKL